VTATIIAPVNSGTRSKVNSKNPISTAPASTAALEISTFTGVPVSASREPA